MPAAASASSRRRPAERAPELLARACGLVGGRADVRPDPFDGALFIKAHERDDDGGIEALARGLLDRGEPLVRRPRVFVRTLGSQRVEYVGHRNDARGDGDLSAALAVGISLAIPALVVLARDGARRFKEARFAEHALAVGAVPLDDRELVA